MCNFIFIQIEGRKFKKYATDLDFFVYICSLKYGRHNMCRNIIKDK